MSHIIHKLITVMHDHFFGCGLVAHICKGSMKTKICTLHWSRLKGAAFFKQSDNHACTSEPCVVTMFHQGFGSINATTIDLPTQPSNPQPRTSPKHLFYRQVPSPGLGYPHTCTCHACS